MMQNIIHCLDSLPWLAYIGILLGSGITGWALIKLSIPLFEKWGLVDKPELYPHEKGRKPLPYPMGIILVINFLLWLPMIWVLIGDFGGKKLLYIALFGLIISIIMMIDDRMRNLGPKFRLAVQIGVGAFFGLTAIKIGYISNVFGGIFHLDQIEALKWSFGESTIYFVPLIITIVWYVLIFNAYNWSDSGNGMASGLGLTTTIVLAVLSIKLFCIDTTEASRQNSLFVLANLAVLIPTIFIFWRFDVAKKFIMGDAGTMYLGFMIASLAIVSGGKIATVAIAMGIYLIDAFYVIARRVFSGKNPMKGDFSHFHHRMSKKGFSPAETRWTVYILSFIFGIGAVFLATTGKIILFLIITVIVVFIEGLKKKGS